MLLLYDFARLARTSVLCTQFLKLFEETGVFVESISEPFSGNTAYHLFVTAIHDKVAEIERDKIVARRQYGKRIAKAQKEQ